MEETFADLIDRKARDAGLNDYQLSAAIGLLPDNKVFSPKQVNRVRMGEQRLIPAAVLWRLVEVLDLDPALAWKKALEAIDFWPKNLTAEQLRMVTRPAVPALAAASATSRRRRSDRPVRVQGKRTQDQLYAYPWPASMPEQTHKAPFVRSPRSNVISGHRPALTIIAGEKDQGETGQEAA
jgi:hypothetical protein